MSLRDASNQLREIWAKSSALARQTPIIAADESWPVEAVFLGRCATSAATRNVTAASPSEPDASCGAAKPSSPMGSAFGNHRHLADAARLVRPLSRVCKAA